MRGLEGANSEQFKEGHDEVMYKKFLRNLTLRLKQDFPNN